jgi:hypothetical protein
MTILLILVSWMYQGVAQAEVVKGEWIEGHRYNYRYITEYSVEEVSQPLKNFPWIQEDCHDDGDRFANWAKTISYEITYSGRVSFDLLGLGFELGGERGKSIEFTFERWIHATKGIRARHILMEEFQNWVGVTRREYMYPDGHTKMGKRTYPIKIEKVNYGLYVKRDILEYCKE